MMHCQVPFLYTVNTVSVSGSGLRRRRKMQRSAVWLREPERGWEGCDEPHRSCNRMYCMCPAWHEWPHTVSPSHASSVCTLKHNRKHNIDHTINVKCIKQWRRVIGLMDVYVQMYTLLVFIYLFFFVGGGRIGCPQKFRHASSVCERTR